MEKIKVLVITLKGDVKYQFGSDKKVTTVLKEIAECKSDFYLVVNTCAIKVSEIVSVERVDIEPKKEDKNG